MKDIFISYKSEDIEKARKVRDHLEKDGFSVWMAPDSITGGASYAAGAKFCPDCGNKINACKNCGADIPAGSNKCPGCGQVICPGCGSTLDANAKFCSGCGKSMVKTCAGCGATVADGIKFCSNCGSKVD